MKQLKFLLTALTVAVMSMSVTSCMNGEENTIMPVFGIATLTNTFPYEFKADGGNVSFVATTASINGLSMNAQMGDIVFLSGRYDTKTQQIDQNTTKINLEMDFAYKINSMEDSEFVYNDEAEVAEHAYANRSIISFSSFSIQPVMYGKRWVCIPVPFFTEKEETSSQHSFELAYVKSDNENKKEMKLRLHHKSLESLEKEKEVNVSFNPYSAYRAFDIQHLLAEFARDNGGQKPASIVIATQEAGKATEITGDNSQITERTYTVQEYKAE